MFEEELKRFDERTQQMKLEMEKSRIEMHEKMHREINRTVYSAFIVGGAVITLLNALIVYAHHLAH